MKISHIANVLPYFIVFLLFFLPAVDTDLGWHVRYGHYFLETGQFLKSNPLTFYLAQYQWQNSYPLYQVLTALIFKFTGLPGLAFSYSLLGIVCFWFFDQLAPKNTPRIFSLVVFLFVIFFGWSVFRLGWRAQVFTFLFLLIEVWSLQKAEKNRIWIAMIPALMALWANIHGGYILGLLLLMFLSVEKLVHKQWGAAIFVLAATGVSAAATLINPHGIGIWEETLRHNQYPLNTLIAEWVAPSFLVKAEGLILGGTLLFFLWSKRLEKRLFWTLCIFCGTVLLFKAQRNTIIFALFAGLGALIVFSKSVTLVLQKKKVEQYTFLASLALIPSLLVINGQKTIQASTDWDTYCSQGRVVYPCKAIEFVRINQPKGTNVFTAYEWGGFLEWQIPQYKPFVDGRMPAWDTITGKSPYTEYLEIIQAQSGWDYRLGASGADWLLIGSGTFLDLEIQRGKSLRWKQVYRDNTAVVYTRQ